jgi:hypothetical protein
MGRNNKELLPLNSLGAAELDKKVSRLNGVHLTRFYNLAERYDFNDTKKAINQLAVIYSLWSIHKGTDYSKNTLRYQYVERIEAKSAELLEVLNSIAVDLRMMRLLELPAMSSDKKFTIPALTQDLFELNKSALSLLSVKPPLPGYKSITKKGRDYLVRELYELFKEGTGKSKKYTKNTGVDDNDKVTTGEFFEFLRDFYNAIDIARSDSSIEKDIQLYAE